MEPSEDDREELLAAAAAVGAAVTAHARTIVQNGTRVDLIIRAAQEVRSSVLTYEKLLMKATGWSNPLRHLGPLPMYRERDPDREDDVRTPANTTKSIHVVADYMLAIDREDDLKTLVEGRWGDRPDTPEEAVRYLFTSDSWDVEQYPPGLINLVQASVDVS